MKEYVVQCRYEWSSRDGVKWSNWFVCDDTKHSENEIEEVIKQSYEKVEQLDKKTKHRHEFRKYGADTYNDDLAQLLEDNKRSKIEMDKLRAAAKKRNRKKHRECLNFFKTATIY